MAQGINRHQGNTNRKGRALGQSEHHTYDGAAIRVTWDARRCIHAAACVHGLPLVFHPGRRPWVDPDRADPEEVANVVRTCPTGALHYAWLDGRPGEPTPEENLMLISADGPYLLRGQLQLMGEFNQVLLHDTRMAICRCGQSGNKPFCDGSHAKAGFKDAAYVKPRGDDEDDMSGRQEPLRIDPVPHGPLVLRGNLRMLDSRGETIGVVEKALFCRCGGSADKPFCDGSHAKVGF